MIKQISLVPLVIFPLMMGCSPNAKQIQKLLEDNPDILTGAIQKNPDKFMTAVQNAARDAEKRMAQKQKEDEETRMEEELKNPKTPELPADRAYFGPEDAPIVLVEYSDFQCPFCKRGYNTVKQILKEYPGKVRLIYKHLPLPMHPLAMPAAKRFEAIAMQDAKKAYLYHDEVFNNFDDLNAQGEKFLDAAAKKVGADVARMKKDMESDKVKARIDADMAEAEKYEISGTPGFVVAGVAIRGAYPFETFKKIIDKKLSP